MTHAPAISGASGAPSIDPANHPDPLAFDHPARSTLLTRTGKANAMQEGELGLMEVQQ